MFVRASAPDAFHLIGPDGQTIAGEAANLSETMTGVRFDVAAPMLSAWILQARTTAPNQEYAVAVTARGSPFTLAVDASCCPEMPVHRSSERW